MYPKPGCTCIRCMRELGHCEDHENVIVTERPDDYERWTVATAADQSARLKAFRDRTPRRGKFKPRSRGR